MPMTAEGITGSLREMLEMLERDPSLGQCVSRTYNATRYSVTPKGRGGAGNRGVYAIKREEMFDNGGFAPDEGPDGLLDWGDVLAYFDYYEVPTLGGWSITERAVEEKPNYTSIAEIRRANIAAGRHFFDSANIRELRCIIYRTIYDGQYFISSEIKGNGDGTYQPRAWTIRRCTVRGWIETVGEEDGYTSLEAAQFALRTLIAVNAKLAEIANS